MKSNNTLSNAFTKGDYKTKLSMIVMGFGCMARKQLVKGIGIFLVEIGFIYFLATSGIHNLMMLPSLGWRKQEEVWNEAKGIYEYTKGDMSILILLYGVATFLIIAAFILFWILQLKHAYHLQLLEEE
jgi:arabinogalactan oligomer/maltooligosaccharide transport system permease protein